MKTETTQVYQVRIAATPQQIWDAITRPEFTLRYFHGAAVEVTPHRMTASGPEGQVWGDSETLEFDPPRRLAYGWRSLYDAELALEAESRVTWEIEPDTAGSCTLTVTHDRLEAAPKTAEHVFGEGWMSVLTGLKRMLEAGLSL